MLDNLFKQFLKEKEYLSGLSPRTMKYLGWVYARWNTIIGEFPDKTNIKDFVIKLSES